MADQFYLDQITRYEEIIVSINTAIEKLATGNHASYTLDSGMTMQKVSRLDIEGLKNTLSYYMKSRENLRNRCGFNRSVVVAIPDF